MKKKTPFYLGVVVQTLNPGTLEVGAGLGSLSTEASLVFTLKPCPKV